MREFIRAHRLENSGKSVRGKAAKPVVLMFRLKGREVKGNRVDEPPIPEPMTTTSTVSLVASSVSGRVCEYDAARTE
jgi:hypothetical protein